MVSTRLCSPTTDLGLRACEIALFEIRNFAVHFVHFLISESIQTKICYNRIGLAPL